MNVDFGRTAADYTEHRGAYPARFYDELERRGLLAPGRHCLDVGTGTGLVARELVRRGGAVTACDPSRELLDEAIALAAEQDLHHAAHLGRAEDLPFPDRAFELAIAAQCWHWFDAPKAAAELRRVLRPDGWLVAVSFDWVPLDDNLPARTEALILEHNPAWQLGGGTGLHPSRLADLTRAGFEAIESWSFDYDVLFTHARWRGRIRASAGVGASLPPDEVAAFDRALAALLAADFPHDPQQVPHRCFAVVGRVP